MNTKGFFRVLLFSSLSLLSLLALMSQQKPTAPLGGGLGAPPSKGNSKPAVPPPPKDAYNGLHFDFYCPVELVLTDPLGRRTGFDPATNTHYDENPDAGYDNEDLLSDPEGPPDPDPPKTLEIWGAVDGDYTLIVNGTGSGAYGADIYARYNYSGYAKATIAALAKVSTSKNVVHTYLIHYENKPGVTATLSGGFNGGGPRPKAVNALMTYANISQTQTKVPGVLDSFPLMIFYSSSIQVTTFKADVNGISISGLFHPEPSGHETVNIPLRSGTNTLSLSVGGSISGKEETDHDTLDLIRE